MAKRAAPSNASAKAERMTVTDDALSQTELDKVSGGIIAILIGDGSSSSTSTSDPNKSLGGVTATATGTKK